MKYLIVGNSAGALGAIEGIRRFDRKGKITVLGEEPYYAYSRPMITKILTGEAVVEDIAMRRPGYYENLGVEVKLGVAATAVDAGAAKVKGSDGVDYAYDRLLMSCGSKPLIPPVPGLAESNGGSFITAADALAIRRKIDEYKPQTVGIVGAGLIGLSLAEALTGMGLQTVIFEQMPRILPSVIDESPSEKLLSLLENKGVRFLTGVSVSSVESAKDGAAEVLLADGSRHGVDLLLVAAGVRPRNESLPEGLALEKGYVKVDERMATGMEGFYACGDMVALPERISGLSKPVPTWPNAYMGGRTAGANMAGAEVEMRLTMPFNAFHYFDIALATAGNSSVDPEATRIIWEEGCYRQVMIKDGRITGLVALGNIDNVGLLCWMMNKGVDVSGYGERIASPNFTRLFLSPTMKTELEKTVKEGLHAGSAGY